MRREFRYGRGLRTGDDVDERADEFVLRSATCVARASERRPDPAFAQPWVCPLLRMDLRDAAEELLQSTEGLQQTTDSTQVVVERSA